MFNDREVKSVSEFVRLIDEIYAEWRYQAGHIWFRGINDSSLGLLPGLCWRNIDDEDSLIEDFQISYAPLNGGKVESPWHFYALMQHYGMPTRLLDWSKSPFIALYFALEKNSENDMAVWILDPFALNKHNHSEHGVFVPGEREIDVGINLNSYLPSSLRSDDRLKIPNCPIAIEPPFSNARILAQQGCFTLHGNENSTIDTYLSKEPDRIFKINISNINRQSMLHSIYRLGFKEEDVYKDLNSLSTRILREIEQSRKK